MGQSLAEMGNEWFQRSANMICIPDTLVTINWKVSKENLREILIEIKINDGYLKTYNSLPCYFLTQSGIKENFLQ